MSVTIHIFKVFVQCPRTFFSFAREHALKLVVTQEIKELPSTISGVTVRGDSEAINSQWGDSEAINSQWGEAINSQWGDSEAINSQWGDSETGELLCIASVEQGPRHYYFFLESEIT